MIVPEIKVDVIDNPDGTINVNVTCLVCGGPTTHTDVYGIWCAKECGREACVASPWPGPHNGCEGFEDHLLAMFKDLL